MIDSPFAPKLTTMQRWEILKYVILCLLFIGSVYTLLHWFPADIPTQTPSSNAVSNFSCLVQAPMVKLGSSFYTFC